MEYKRGEGASPLTMELAKLLSVLKGDRMVIRDKNLSTMRSVEEKEDWEEAISDLEEYIRGYNRNKIIIARYENKRERRRGVHGLPGLLILLLSFYYFLLLFKR